MKLEDILKEYSRDKNIPLLSLDNEGICRILLNEITLINFEKSENHQSFYIYTTIGFVPQANESRISMQAIRGNLFGKETGRASIGYDPKSHLLVLFMYIEENNINYSNFLHLLEEFASYAIYWLKKVEAIQQQKIDSLDSPLFAQETKGLRVFFA